MPDVYWTYACGIDGSKIVGYYKGEGFNDHGFFYNGSSWTTLDMPEATAGTWAFGIDCNNIVGYYDNNSGIHGFLYNGSSWTALDMPGATDTLAFGIDGNNIVGYYYDSSGEHGFLYDGSRWTTIDMPGALWTQAFGIDGSNIVGCSDGHGFLYTVPEPTTLLLLGFGAAMARKRWMKEDR